MQSHYQPKMYKTSLPNNIKSPHQEKQIFHNQSYKLKQIITSNIYMLFMSALTVYSIFAIDIDKGFFNQNVSIFFSSVNVLSMVVFTVEIILNSIVQKEYICNFYFWIDVLSTAMMLLQLVWIQDIISSVTNVKVAARFTRVSKASRFSKIGARSTKILKLIRLIKLMKFYKQKQKQVIIHDQNEQIVNNSQLQAIKQKFSINNEILQNCKQPIHIIQNRPNVDPIKQKQIQLKWQMQSQQMKRKQQAQGQLQAEKGTKIGEILKYQIQKNIVILVMGIIMIIPILSAETWFNKTADMEPSTQNYLYVVQDYNNSTYFSSWLQSFVQISLNSSRPIVFIQFQNFIFSAQSSLKFDQSKIKLISDLRQAQKIMIQTNYFNIIYSKKQETKITSWLNMIQSLVIMFLLLFTTIAFIRDLENYALNPLQKMYDTVLKIKKNQFSVMQNNQKSQQQDNSTKKKQKEQLQLQTNILQNFFIKISTLLALGVGQTPFNTSIASNYLMDKNQSTFQQASPLQVQGVFMCFQVAHIKQVIVHLKDKASCYINVMLEIFHETVIQNGGYIFHQDLQYSFVCWKITSHSQAILSKNIHIKEEKKITQLAFIAYAKFIQKVSQDQRIKKYSFLNQHIWKFQNVKFHIGIHFGKAFCGVIGSQFKVSIRATGQDILISKILCGVAKNYQLQNIISCCYQKYIPFCFSILRKIQQFRFEQFQKDKILSTFSICVAKNLKINQKILTSVSIKDNNKITKQINFSQTKLFKDIFKIREQILKNNFKNKTQQLTNICRSYLKKNTNIQQFLDLWRQCNSYYEQGQWANAKVGFQSLKDFVFGTNDVLIQLRLAEIGNIDQAPANWKKYKKISLFI